MANLVIKPASGSGNKVVFQNQTGLVDALTVDDSGNTTLAGTANNLGTVTAGSIAGGAITSATTFPAGHVVQTTTATYADTKTDVGTNSGGPYTSTVVTGSITPQYDNSSIIVHANFSVHIHSEASGDTGYAMRWYKSASGITDGYPDEMNTNPHATQRHATFYRNAFQYVSLGNYYSMSMMNNDCETTNQITYNLHVASYYTDGNCWVGSTTWGNTRWMIYFQEIKR